MVKRLGLVAAWGIAGSGAGSLVGSASAGHGSGIGTIEFVCTFRPISFPATHNQAFKWTLNSGALLRNFSRRYLPLRAFGAPLRHLTWRYAAPISKDSGKLKVVCVPHEFFRVRGVSVPVEPNLVALRQKARAADE